MAHLHNKRLGVRHQREDRYSPIAKMQKQRAADSDYVVFRKAAQEQETEAGKPGKKSKMQSRS